MNQEQLQTPPELAPPVPSGWARFKCRDASGKPYWHLKNETTGEWFDVAVLRDGGIR